MVWYHLYTDITPPPFIWLSHDFLLILKVKNLVTFNSFFSISPELSKGGKKLQPLEFFFAHKYVRGRYGTNKRSPTRIKTNDTTIPDTTTFTKINC